MIFRRILRGITLAIALSGMVAGISRAQGTDPAAGYPNQPVKMVIGFAAGGPTDVIGRLLAQHMTASMGQTVVVENRPAAAAWVATKEVARARPDGYTLLFTSLTHNVNRLLMGEKAEYDPVGDFAPISLAANLPLVLVTAYDAPYKSLDDLIKAARAAPDTISFGSSGNGGSAHLAAAMLGTMANLKMLHVPFRGNAPALTEVMAGRVSFMFYPSIGIAALVADKRVRVLAVGASKPLADFPGVPTMDASGFPGFELTAPWVGLLAPAGTPDAIVQKLNHEMLKALNRPDVQQRLRELGGISVGTTAAQFREFLVSDRERWAKVIQAAGIKAE